MLKYDGSGVPLWTNYFSGPGFDAINSLGVDACGNVVAVGSEWVAGQLDWRIQKYDTGGNVLWSATYAGASGNNDEAACTAITPDGRLLVAGYETVAGEGQNVLIREYAPDLRISCPADISAAASSPAGASITYPAATATDTCGIVSVACDPPSGSVFPIGDSTVICAATNAGGYLARCTFRIHVQGPLEQLNGLMAVIQGSSIPSGIKTALLAKLSEAQKAMSQGDTLGACHSLQAFINQVKALAGKKLTIAEATALVAAADQIRATLGCP